MNRPDSKTRSQLLSCILEGCSIRATVRMTGVSKKAIMRLMLEAGNAAADYQDRVFQNLRCRRIQVDELWGFVYCKEKNVTNEIASKTAAAGDVWLWIAIDADTKLVPSFMLGNRDGRSAKIFIDDLKSRLAGRVELTSDGHKYILMP